VSTKSEYRQFSESNDADEAVKTHYRRLRQEVVTRWNSVLEMVCSLLCHKEEVNEALKRTGNYELVLKSLDWNILSQVCRLLEAFKTLTDAASGPFV
jgi:hypothetical protein